MSYKLTALKRILAAAYGFSLTLCLNIYCLHLRPITDMHEPCVESKPTKVYSILTDEWKYVHCFVCGTQLARPKR